MWRQIRLAVEDWSDDKYREIYDELKSGKSLANLVRMLNSELSTGMWSKYDRGLVKLSLTMKNELRHFVGSELLPLPIGDSLPGTLNGNVWLADDEPAEVVLMASESLRDHMDGKAPVRPATRVTRPRRRRVNVSLRPETMAVLSRLRGLETWDQFMERAAQLLRADEWSRLQ